MLPKTLPTVYEFQIRGGEKQLQNIFSLIDNKSFKTS